MFGSAALVTKPKKLERGRLAITLGAYEGLAVSIS